MANVHIVTDSSCDLPPELVDELGITVVPLTIRFGDREYTDREDFTPEEFWKLSANSEQLPETAAPSPGAFEQAFRAAADAGAPGVVCINISAALSATMQSAEAAAKALEGIDVRIVNSRTVTMGLGAIVVHCARMAADGRSVDEIEATARDMADRTKAFALIETLENLKKGGRIGGAQALVGGLLSIKPIIYVFDEVHEESKQRTRSKALTYLVDKVKSEGRVENLAVMHANTDDVDQFVERLQPLYDGEIIVGHIGAVIGAHAGMGAIGMTYQVPAPD